MFKQITRPGTIQSGSGWAWIFMPCDLSWLCCNMDIDGAFELVRRIISPLQVLKPIVMFLKDLARYQSLGVCSTRKSTCPYLLCIMEVLNGIRNEIGTGNPLVLKDEIIPLFNKLSRQLLLALVGIKIATRSEKEDMSSTLGMRPCSRRSRQRR